MYTLQNRRLYNVSILFCAIALLVPAFINNFPFLYADTGTYVHIGFTDEISYIRPLLYGLFIRHISLYDSMWLVVCAQAGIVSWTINRFLRIFFGTLPAFLPIASISLIAFTTGAGVTTGMLMPDFLTPVLLLLTTLLLLSKDLDFKKAWLPVMILWLALASHHSHPYILILLLIGLTLVEIICRIAKRKLLSFRRILFLSAIALIAYLSIPTLHYLRSGDFVRSHSANVFLLNRMNQMGLLVPFLDKQCDHVQYSICAYKDGIPTNFLWSQDSPVYKDGGWTDNNELYRPVVRDFFRSAHLVKKFAIKSLETTLLQFFSFDVVIIVPERANGYPYGIFKEFIPEFIPAIEMSLQYRDKWNNAPIDFAQRIVVFGSILLIIYLLWFQGRYALDVTHKKVLLIFAGGLWANAAICGCISMVDPRFQSRVIWIVPMVAIALACHLYQIRQAQKTINKT